MFFNNTYFLNIYKKFLDILNNLYYSYFHRIIRVSNIEYDNFHMSFKDDNLVKHVFNKCYYKNIYYDWIILNTNDLNNLLIIMHNKNFYKKINLILKEQNTKMSKIEYKDYYNVFYNIFYYKKMIPIGNKNIYYNCIHNDLHYYKIEIDKSNMYDFNNIKMRLCTYNYWKEIQLELVVDNFF